MNSLKLYLKSEHFGMVLGPWLRGMGLSLVPPGVPKRNLAGRQAVGWCELRILRIGNRQHHG